MAIHQCSKEDKIDAMEKNLTKLNKVVLEGTNGDSLLSMAKNTQRYSKEIHKDFKTLSTAVSGLMIFQAEVQTERDLKQEIAEKKERRRQWIIGLLVGTVVALISILIAVV